MFKTYEQILQNLNAGDYSVSYPRKLVVKAECFQGHWVIPRPDMTCTDPDSDWEAPAETLQIMGRSSNFAASSNQAEEPTTSEPIFDDGLMLGDSSDLGLDSSGLLFATDAPIEDVSEQNVEIRTFADTTTALPTDQTTMEGTVKKKSGPKGRSGTVDFFTTTETTSETEETVMPTKEPKGHRTTFTPVDGTTADEIVGATEDPKGHRTTFTPADGTTSELVSTGAVFSTAGPTSTVSTDEVLNDSSGDANKNYPAGPLGPDGFPETTPAPHAAVKIEARAFRPAGVSATDAPQDMTTNTTPASTLESTELEELEPVYFDTYKYEEDDKDDEEEGEESAENEEPEKQSRSGQVDQSWVGGTEGFSTTASTLPMTTEETTTEFVESDDTSTEDYVTQSTETTTLAKETEAPFIFTTTVDTPDWEANLTSEPIIGARAFVGGPKSVSQDLEQKVLKLHEKIRRLNHELPATTGVPTTTAENLAETELPDFSYEEMMDYLKSHPRYANTFKFKVWLGKHTKGKK